MIFLIPASGSRVVSKKAQPQLQGQSPHATDEIQLTLLIDVAVKANDVVSHDLRHSLQLDNQTTDGCWAPALLSTKNT